MITWSQLNFDLVLTSSYDVLLLKCEGTWIPFIFHLHDINDMFNDGMILFLIHLILSNYNLRP